MPPSPLTCSLPPPSPLCSKYLVCASYLQIYNEVISDMLKPEHQHPSLRKVCLCLCHPHTQPVPSTPLPPLCSKYLVRASYLQIYNEVISDMLKPERTNLIIREDRRRGVFVEGLSEWVVRSPGEVYMLMQRGQAMVSVVGVGSV